jgi:D-erythronate 2-dehydrogenase
LATVGEQIEALRQVAGETAVQERDETIARIVAGWPSNLDPARAKARGFRADDDFSAIIRAYLEDDFNG